MQTNPPVIGFVGFGEAGYHLAKGLRSAGIARILAFDIQDTERIRARAAETQTELVHSPQEVNASDIIFSVVTAQAALTAANECAAHLKPHHFYVDLNSVSPATKCQIKAALTTAQFVEGSIMAPVPPYGHKVPILLNGPAASTLAQSLSPFGMRLEVMSGEPGAAAAVKMCRSIVVKGLEALLLECSLAARHFHAEEKVFSSLEETFPGIKWPDLAKYMIGRIHEHGERRAREMEEVASMLRSAGLPSTMAEATALVQARNAK